MDPIFEPSFMSRLLSWQLDVSHDRSARVLMLVEQARQAEQLARAEGDEKGSSARLAFQKWRQALEAGPELALVRATLMRYLETDVASVEERAQVLDELAKACTREERVAIALLRAERVERAGDRRAAGQLIEDALRLEAGDRRCLQRLERLSRGDADWAGWLRWASSLREHSSDARLKLAIAVEEALTLEFQVEDPRACIELCASAGAETSIDLAASASREELALGRWSRAVSALEREASLHAELSQRVQRLYEAARVALRRLDDAPRAARLLAPVLEQAPLEVLRLLREAYLEQASPELAKVYRLLAERALAPEQKARYLCLLGDEWGEGPEAVRVMMEAVELAPTYTSASFGLELAGVGAAVDLLELMARRARVQASAPMMVHVGRLAWDVYRDLERAERCFREALVFPGSEQLIFGAFGALDALAELLEATGRYDELVEVLSWAMSRPMEQQDRLRLQSRFADAVSFSARASLEQRVEAWHTLLHFEPSDAYAFRQLRELLELSGRWQDALAVSERFNESFELSDADWCYVLSWECGVLASRLPEGLEGSLAFFDRAIEREPRHPAAWCGRARRLMASGRMRALVADYRRRVELALSERERLRLLLDLAALYERALDDVQAAALLYEELLAAGWHSLDVVHGALRTLSKLEQSASAESWAALRERRVRVLRALVGVEADPAFVHVWHYVLGVSCEELGDFESAAASFSAAVAAEPRSATAQLAHHRAELGCGRAGRLVEEIESQLAADPNSPDVVELLERMLQLSTPESEARVIERLLMHYPQHLGGLLRLFRRSSRRGTAKAIAEVFRAMAASVGSGQEYVALLQSASLFDVSTQLHEEEREKELWQIVELRPHDMSSLLRLLSGLSEGESRAERIKVFGALARGAQDESDKASHMLALARLLGDDTQYERAQLALDEVLRVAPRYEPAVRLLRIISEELGDHSRLADVMELQARASDDAGRSIEQWLRAAELRRKQLNDIVGAIAALQEVLTVDPQNEEAFASLQEIYSAQGRMGELFELLMERRHVLASVEERRKTILRAAELAYNRMHDEERAVLAHRALLAQDPSFVRSYRVIAEIMEAKQRWREALEAHEGVLRSTKERALLARSWQRVGEILEDHLGDFEKASVAYRKALESQPESSETLSRLARVFEQLKKWDDAVATLQWLGQVERVPLKRKEVLLRLSRLRLEHFADAAACEEALVAAREIDPADMELTRDLADAYAKRGWAKRREDFLRASYEEYRAHFQTNVSRPLALQAMYRLAEWLGDQDRKFCLASVLSFVGAADEQQQSHYKRTLEVVGRRLPSRALPAEKSAGVVASGLSVGMIHLMRQSEAAVAKVSPHSTRQRGVQRRFRVSPSARPDLALLVPFARVFGMDLPDIFLVPDRGESMTLLPGEELAFVMDERDLEPVMLPETMVRVAIGCASLSMGMACFARAEAELFEDYLLALFSCIFPGRRFYKPAKPALVEGIGRHLTRKSLDSMSAYALELVEQLSAEFVGQQRLALLSTAMRLGLATSLDPRPGLTVIARDGDAGHFEVVPVMRDALLFLVNERYVEMRRETGVAIR